MSNGTVKRDGRPAIYGHEKYNNLLGTDVSREEMLEIFKKIEVAYDEKTNELICPSFRQDLLGQADIAEEVAVSMAMTRFR